MATDPYHTFVADLKSSLDVARQLSQRYQTLQQQRRKKGPTSLQQQQQQQQQQHQQTYSTSAASSSSNITSPPPSTAAVEGEIRDLFTELQDRLETLENDINDVQESVEMVERRGPELFGVDDAELGRRKRFVQSCSDEVRNLGKLIHEESRNSNSSNRYNNRSNKGFQTIDMDGRRKGGLNVDDDDEEEEDANVAFEMEQQQHLLSRQDNTLDLIGSTLTSLKRQAGTLGQEIGEQVDLIGALDSEVDTSQSKLTRAMGRMDELVRRSDDRMGGWCVWILILLLFGLLLVAILI